MGLMDNLFSSKAQKTQKKNAAAQDFAAANRESANGLISKLQTAGTKIPVILEEEQSKILKGRVGYFIKQLNESPVIAQCSTDNIDLELTRIINEIGNAFAEGDENTIKRCTAALKKGIIEYRNNLAEHPEKEKGYVDNLKKFAGTIEMSEKYFNNYKKYRQWTNEEEELKESAQQKIDKAEEYRTAHPGAEQELKIFNPHDPGTLSQNALDLYKLKTDAAGDMIQCDILNQQRLIAFMFNNSTNEKLQTADLMLKSHIEVLTEEQILLYDDILADFKKNMNEVTDQIEANEKQLEETRLTIEAALKSSNIGGYIAKYYNDYEKEVARLNKEENEAPAMKVENEPRTLGAE